MSIFIKGRLCLKTAGRDAGLKCVVVEAIDNMYVLVDGQTRRKKVNIKHLEPFAQVIEIPSKASHEDILKILQKEGISATEKKSRKETKRTRKTKKTKKVSSASAAAKKEKPAKKESKKEEKA